MPYTLNGIGTWYYGKKNEHTINGRCEFCGKNTQLKSYDTTKFFVFVFIPILPLGKKRIIDECGCCRRHRVVSLKEWENSLNQTIDSLYEKWIQEPNNVGAATELFNSMVYFRSMDRLISIARDVRMHCSDNAQILNRLGLVYSFFNRFGEAEDFFNASLAINQDRDVEENLAEALMKGLRPDEARPYVSYITQEKVIDKLYYILLLIESYQYIGDHRSALEVIEECEKAFPAMKDEKQLRKYRKTSQRNYNNSRRIKGFLISEGSGNKKERNTAFILPKLVFPIMIVLALMFYIIGSFLVGLSRDVYLVNGLDTHYAIEVNGEVIDLQPMSRKKVKLREGTVKVDILDLNSADEKSLTADINTPFWIRLFNKPIFIINPDKVAVFLWEETQYAINERDNESYEPDYRYYTGKHFYKLNSVNYLFKEFPESVDISEDIKKVTRTRLTQLNENELALDYTYILETLDLEDAMSYAKLRLMYEPDDEINIYLYLSYCDKDSAIEFLKTGLDKRPVLINWHRAYQTYMESYEPSYNLEEEYCAYLENERDNKALCYLLSRILENPKDAEEMLLRSIEGNEPCPYGYYGLAYQSLSDGNFEQALPYAKKAVEALPNQDSFNMILEQAMLAQGEYELLLKKNKSQQKTYPYDGGLVVEEVGLHMAQGNPDAAKKAISGYLTRNEANGVEFKQMWDTYLNGILAYCSNDVEAYGAAIEGFDAPQLAFENAFIKGEFDIASEIAINNGFGGSYFLLLYLAQDNPDSATQYLSQAIAAYRKGDKTDRLIADYLSGAKSFELDEVKSVVLLPGSKHVVMVALGKINPIYQKDLNAFAKKLNYNKVFPYHFINEIAENS